MKMQDNCTTEEAVNVEKSAQDIEDEAFERWFWDKYIHQPSDLDPWSDYWLRDD